MEKLKLSITKQLKQNPSAEAQVRDCLGNKTYADAMRVSDSATLELLEAGYTDIAVIRNAVAFEALKLALETGQTDDENVPKVLQISTGIDSGMRLLWLPAYGNSIWQNGLREPRLCTPFPNAMRADAEIANVGKENPTPVPLMYKVAENLSRAEIDKIRGDCSCGDTSWAGCPAFYGYYTPEEVSGNGRKWNTGEWEIGTGTQLGVTEYGLWVSAKIKEVFDSPEASELKRVLANFIRNFNF